MSSTAVTFPRQGSTFAPLADEKKDGHVRAHAIQTVNASADALYQLWRREEFVPLWMEGVVSITRTGDRTSHWVMSDPGTGKQFEFDSEIIDDEPGQHLSMCVIEGMGKGSTDDITFEPHPSGRGTVVTLISDFVMPGGVVGNAVAAVVSRSPRQMTIENLRHLKQLAESGEIPRVEGQPHGKRGVMGRWKEFMLGETNPTPPGTSEREQRQDYPKQNELGDKREVA
ncbi:MAG: cyclase [Acidobacteria bacterium]|nr:cyclase [Acidobacteriota bacterium]